MRSFRSISAALVTFFFLLTACQAGTPTVDPKILTQTAEVQLTQSRQTEEYKESVQAKFNAQLSATATLTPTLTLTPSPQPTQTLTPTFPPTRTATFTASPTITDTPSPFACMLVSQSPMDGTTVKPNSKVTVTWKIRNVGKVDWDTNLFDFVQLGGDKIADEGIYDLPVTVKPNETVEMKVLLNMPGTTGSFRTDWKFYQVETGFVFCPLNITVWSSNN